jgi:hypothetical protein
MSLLRKLVGRRVIDVRISPDKTVIAFKFDVSALVIQAVGDCCSESWFEHISGLEYLLAAVVRDIDVNDDESEVVPVTPGRQEVERAYSYSIYTERGTCQIEMRNSSNGYYGGYLEEVKGHGAKPSYIEQGTQSLSVDF